MFRQWQNGWKSLGGKKNMQFFFLTETFCIPEQIVEKRCRVKLRLKTALCGTCSGIIRLCELDNSRQIVLDLRGIFQNKPVAGLLRLIKHCLRQKFCVPADDRKRRLDVMGERGKLTSALLLHVPLLF